MSVTLKDIAERAGVSISTVSRVINNDKDKPASQETAQKIWKLVKEMGYIPNFHAKNLKSGKIVSPNLYKTIGCILASPKDTFKDQFFSQIMMGIQSEAVLHEYNVGYSFSYFEDKSALFQYITSSAVDGYVLLGRINEDLFNFIKSKIDNLVYVGLNRIGRDLDEVICDAYEATSCAVEYLISLGHTQIGYIGEIPELTDSKVINEHRFKAFKNTLEKHNIPLEESYIKNITLSSKEGYNAMTEIIKAGILPSAIFCGNDITAIGVMKAIHKSGLKIPKDISVIGLDNIEVSEYFRPSLTTIHVPKEELGRFAVKLLIDKINGGHQVNTLVKLPFELVIRESCSDLKKVAN